uniref:MOR2-PAG1_N domain-containing protein n=1 Tax=Gongylonema pulchrum TaxID=637853 RepID=A0A183DKT3_9BILA
LIFSYFSKEASLKAVLNHLIRSLMSHLSSRSEEHRQHGKLCIEEITKYIGNLLDKLFSKLGFCLSNNTALLTSFAAATKQANVKQKPFMLSTLSKLNEMVYPNKPRQVEMTGLSVLWELLRSPAQYRGDSEVRSAVKSYARVLAQCFGEKTIMDLSASHISPSQKQALKGLIS